MTCSIVILNWNGEDMLRQFLPSVISHSQSFTLPNGEECTTDVVVADNGSTDHSLDVLRTTFPSVKVITLDQNYGFAEGYNRALEHIQSDYSVLLNSDVEVTPHWLEPLVEFLHLNPNYAAVQPKILAYASISDNPHRFEHAGAAGGFIDRLGYPFCRGRILAAVEDDNHQYDTTTDVFWTSGACMVIRTSIYKQLGGLDADFFAHMEEIDLCWRMQLHGYQLACVTDSAVFHVGGGSLSYESPRKTFLNFRNNLLMLYKNLPASRLWWVMTCRWFLDYVAALQLLLTGQKANAQAAINARREYKRMKKAYRTKRQANLHDISVSYPPTIQPRSIIFDYYILHKRK